MEAAMGRSGWASCCLLLAIGCGGSADDAPPGATEGDSGGASSQSAGAGGSSQVGSTNAGGINSGQTGGSSGSNTGTSGNTGTGGGAGASDGAGAKGGGSGMGGTSDAGQPDLPHTVGSCSGLGAPGTWELISPPAWKSSAKNEALSVAVNPQNPSIVFAAAGDKTNGGNGGTGIHKSTDCGATWTKISTGAHGADLETGDTWQLKIDPTDPQVMYATNGYGNPPSLFKSVNGGVDWAVLVPDGGDLAKSAGGNFVQTFSMDPTDSKHLVLTFHFNCTGTFAPMCMGETKDGGTTWRAFKGPTNGWSEGAGPIVLGSNTWLYATGGALYYTKDSAATWEKVSSNGGGALYRAKDGTLFLGGDNGMLRSKDGYAWTQVPNAPRASGVLGDGTNLYAVFQNDYSGQPFHTAKESDPTKWTQVPTPTIKQGGGSLAYDGDHHVLYAACWGAGLWRAIVQ